MVSFLENFTKILENVAFWIAKIDNAAGDTPTLPSSTKNGVKILPLQFSFT